MKLGCYLKGDLVRLPQLAHFLWKVVISVSSFMTCPRVCNKNNTTGATSRTGTVFPSREPGLIPFSTGSCCSVFYFLCSILCLQLSVFLSLFFWPLYCLSVIESDLFCLWYLFVLVFKLILFFNAITKHIFNIKLCWCQRVFIYWLFFNAITKHIFNIKLCWCQRVFIYWFQLAVTKRQIKRNSEWILEQKNYLHANNNNIYPAISTFAVQICYTIKFLLYSY
jgi:hypothetical protein